MWPADCGASRRFRKGFYLRIIGRNRSTRYARLHSLRREPVNVTPQPLETAWSRLPEVSSIATPATGGSRRPSAFARVGSVLAGPSYIHDQQLTPRPEYSDRFADRCLTACPSADVVDRKIGDDQVEALVRKRQGHHVGGVQFDPILNALGERVAKRRLERVAGLIKAPP